MRKGVIVYRENFNLKSGDEVWNDHHRIAIKRASTGKVELYSENGESFIKEGDNCYDSVDFLKYGCVVTKIGEIYNLYSKEGNIKYTGFKAYKVYDKWIKIVDFNEKKGVLDQNGEQVIPIRFAEANIGYGIVFVNAGKPDQNGAYSLPDGAEIVPPEYDCVKCYQGNIFVSKNGKTNVFTVGGIPVTFNQ